MKKVKSKKALFLLFIGALAIAELLAFLWYGDGIEIIKSYFRQEPPAIHGILLFYSDKCSQCDKVETFIKNNNVESKISFTRLKVSKNSENESRLADKAQICGWSTSDVGVPFVWDGENRCVMGYVDVITFFKEKLPSKP